MSSPIPSRSDVDEIIKKKRKERGSQSLPSFPRAATSAPRRNFTFETLLSTVDLQVREHKACYPCRSRKVRCDSKIPCKTCIERNHADICSWNPPAKKVDTGVTHNSTASSNVILSSEEWDRICTKLHTVEKSLTELKQDLLGVTEGSKPLNGLNGTPSNPESSEEPSGPRYVKAMDINEQSPLTGETIHLGGGSIPALVRALRKHSETTPAVQEVFGSNVLPLFGLDNENATYPFVSLWGGVSSSADRVAELRKALPNDAECLETFRHYRDGGYVTYPGVVEVDKFENDLLVFLTNRRTGQSETENASQSMYGNTLQWAALLFAVFASGAQFSPMPKEQRNIVSQLYGCCSFECLRLVNYLAHASLEVVQSMLVLGNVLANGRNAGAAWSLLGMTTRLAQSLGLHRASEEPVDGVVSQARSRTWWAILWQDSILSISYDRASSSASADSPYPPNSKKEGLTYHEAMYRVCRVGLDTIRNRLAPQSIEHRLGKCGGLLQEIQTAQDSALPHLRSLDSCRSINDQSEYWMLLLHASYMKSELGRPAISPSTAEFDKSNDLRKLCITNLMSTVEAFLGVANVAPIHTRSWAVMQRALSSALLLGILGEPLRSAEAQTLLKNMVEVMENPATSGATSLSAPVQRSLTALRKLSALESRTPRLIDEPAGPDVKSTVDPSFENNFAQQPEQQPNGLLNFDTSSYFLPSPLSGFEDDSSPYALMDSIIWGGDRQNM